MNGIVLIRHAETDLSGKFCGHSDPDLNTAGENKLHSLVHEVAALGIERIYSSDLRRAARTASAISERLGVPVEFRPGLREIHFGLWEALRWEEVHERYPAEAELWLGECPTRSAPGGEPYREFVARVESDYRWLIGNGGSTRAVVTHRGVMQYALTHFFGFSETEARQRTENYGAIVIATRTKVHGIV